MRAVICGLSRALAVGVLGLTLSGLAEAQKKKPGAEQAGEAEASARRGRMCATW